MIIVEIESSSDDDDMDDSDDPEKESIEATTVMKIHIIILFLKRDDFHLGSNQYSTNPF